MKPTEDDLRVARAAVSDGLTSVCKSYGWEFTDTDAIGLIEAVASAIATEREKARKQAVVIVKDYLNMTGKQWSAKYKMIYNTGALISTLITGAAAIRAGDKEAQNAA